jgi:two-component system, cell cycle response regulator DivK
MNPQIVVIEDNPQSARMVAKLLRRAGVDVTTEDTGEGGLEAVMEQHPDLVLVDLGLPDLDGQTVVGLLRQQPGLENLLVIAFTAWPPETAHEMAKAYGCDGVISKPIDTRTFADEVKSYLAGVQHS